jgi:hypothetical protein
VCFNAPDGTAYAAEPTQAECQLERGNAVTRFCLAVLLALSTTTAAFAHGGGCRKSSPPGQCCHMEKKVGKVHCH